MIITITILSILLLVSIYINWNLLRKTERLQDFADNLSRWVDNLNQTASNITTQVNAIDEKGLFKSDDYVGSIWKELSILIKNLDNIIIKERDESGNDSN